MNLTYRYADLGDVRLHYGEAGEGPLVVLLHGFPQHHLMWRHQVPVLVRRGFRVVVPDLRGYNLSDMPAGVASYRVDLLARDVERLVLEVGEDRATVVGHDWGAVVGWFAAMRYPGLVERLAVLNGPHPARFLFDAPTMPRQLVRSLYALLFQLPELPERVLSARDFAVLRRGFLTDPARAIPQGVIERYVEAMARPGRLTAALNYYRAAFRRPAVARALLGVVEAPTLVVWGERDAFLLPTLAAPRPLWVPDLRVERLPQAGHWVAEDSPETVNGLLVDFVEGP